MEGWGERHLQIVQLIGDRVVATREELGALSRSRELGELIYAGIVAARSLDTWALTAAGLELINGLAPAA